ncbi:MAG: hypothetical protein NVSMB57_04510 [Actinomycetota bacterium]
MDDERMTARPAHLSFVDQSVPVLHTPADGSRMLIQAVQRLSLARTVGEVQEIVRITARRLCGADGATFILRDGDRCYYADEDAISPLWKGQRFPMSACISGWAMLNRQSVAIEDIYADARIPHEAYKPTFVKSLLMVPMRRADPIGAIGNYWSSWHRPTPSEIELLQALADSTAVAMENVRVWSELESHVTARTDSLKQSLLVSEELLATLAHELRHPLFAAQGRLQLAMRKLPGGEANVIRQDLIQARASVAECMDVVNRQLDLAKMRAGALRAHTSAVNPGDLVDSLVETYQALRSNLQLELSAAVAPNLPMLETDVHLLGQALRNLVSNSLKFTDAGTIVVAAEPAGDAVRFSVTDTGIGIDEQAMDAIFEDYTQVDQVQAGRPPGTGLGLPYVRKIAAILGATLEARSEKGVGSTFALVIPVGRPTRQDSLRAKL